MDLTRLIHQSVSLTCFFSIPFIPPAARSLPPVAHASGSHTLTLPNNSLVLRGSITNGDQTEVHYLWVRDSQSPAAGVSTVKVHQSILKALIKHFLNIFLL